MTTLIKTVKLKVNLFYMCKIVKYCITNESLKVVFTIPQYIWDGHILQFQCVLSLVCSVSLGWVMVISGYLHLAMCTHMLSWEDSLIIYVIPLFACLHMLNEKDFPFSQSWL